MALGLGCAPERPLPADPPSVLGELRLAAYAERSSEVGQAQRVRQVTRFVNGVDYGGMEDNDLRGFLDGRFIYGWNQPGQVHVRVGRRFSRKSKYGEYELFRVIQRWPGVALVPGARVRAARLGVAVERGPTRPVTLMLYEVLKDWNPGEGGHKRNNISRPREGEVWWGERAHGEAEWGLPGVGFASQSDPDADTPVTALAEARWTPGDPWIEFSSSALAAYVERRVAAGAPLLFLMKMADHLEDQPDAILRLWSGNLGEARNPALRPWLELEWDSPHQVAGTTRPLHLEHGRELALPVLPAPGATHVAASFVADDGHEVPTLEVRGGDGWRSLALPARVDRSPVVARVRAVRDPVQLGDVFETGFRDTWVTTSPPEEEEVWWTFVSPDGERHRVRADYAGDFRWQVRFEPAALGRWRYFYECELDRAYRSPTGAFDVLPGDRANVRRELEALRERIRAAAPADEAEAVAAFGPAFWRLQRAALRHETPASFRADGRETFQLLTEIREALSRDEVPDRPKLKSTHGPWKR